MLQINHGEESKTFSKWLKTPETNGRSSFHRRSSQRFSVPNQVSFTFDSTYSTASKTLSFLRITAIFRAFCLPSDPPQRQYKALQFPFDDSLTQSQRMAFHSVENLRPRTIDIDLSSSTCDSPEIQQRLDRIQANYDQLDTALVDIENKLALDERLAALDDDNVDFESEFGIKPKRKWRSPKANRKRRPTRSANPRKPR